MFGKTLSEDNDALRIDFDGHRTRGTKRIRETNTVVVENPRISLIDCLTYMCRNIAIYDRMITRFVVTRALILPYLLLRSRRHTYTHLIHTQSTSCTFERKEHTRCFSQTLLFVWQLKAISKIYVRVELMRFMSLGELLRIRPCCRLLSGLWLYTRCPRSRELSPDTCTSRNDVSRDICRRVLIKLTANVWHLSS